MYDGVHRGHQLIVGRAVRAAQDGGLPCAVLTFDPHPAEVLRPGSHPTVLTSPTLKAELLARLGVDVMWVLPFTREFSRLPAPEFVHAVLVRRLHVATVVVGENFRFGHRAAGDLARLRELGEEFGFTTEGVPLVGDGGVLLSSTYVRACVDAGDVARAAEALGRWHVVEGVVVRGDRRGRRLGWPTANVEPIAHAAVPADGVYAGWLVVAGQRLPGAVSVGTNPTFAGRERRVEVFVLDREVDLYGVHVRVEFVARLRGMVRYETPELLAEQIGRDVELTRRTLSAAGELPGAELGGPDRPAGSDPGATV
jgi:riboflavin kinase/FMN adenylyltransferase